MVKAIKGMQSGKMSADSQKAQIAVRIDGEEKLVDVDAPMSVVPDQHVTVLVDPHDLRHAVFVAAH